MNLRGDGLVLWKFIDVLHLLLFEKPINHEMKSEDSFMKTKEEEGKVKYKIQKMSINSNKKEVDCHLSDIKGEHTFSSTMDSKARIEISRVSIEDTGASKIEPLLEGKVNTLHQEHPMLTLTIENNYLVIKEKSLQPLQLSASLELHVLPIVYKANKDFYLKLKDILIPIDNLEVRQREARKTLLEKGLNSISGRNLRKLNRKNQSSELIFDLALDEELKEDENKMHFKNLTLKETQVKVTYYNEKNNIVYT